MWRRQNNAVNGSIPAKFARQAEGILPFGKTSDVFHSLAMKNKELAEAVAKVLNEMRADGSYQKLFERYGMKSVEGTLGVRAGAL